MPMLYLKNKKRMKWSEKNRKMKSHFPSAFAVNCSKKKKKKKSALDKEIHNVPVLKIKSHGLPEGQNVLFIYFTLLCMFFSLVK